MNPRDRVVIVTGASMGIGEAVARAYAREGARVVLAARSLDRLDALARELGPERALAVRADLRERADAAALVEQTLARFGRVDILVNNAGVGLYSRLAEMDMEQCRELFALNVFAPLHLAQAVAPHMKKQGGGQIINVGSVAGKVAFPWMGAYCASKFALCALTNALRMELRPWNIHVIGVYPGTVETPFSKNAYGDPRPPRMSTRFAISADDVARAVLHASRFGLRAVVVPRALWMFIGFHRLFPGFVDRLVGGHLVGAGNTEATEETRKSTEKT